MDTPYLLRGVMPVETESSVLISSSKYLNHPRLREWVAMILLKKNGPDFPPQAEMHELPRILDELRDHAHIEAMFAEERKVNPALDRWFENRFISRYTIEDFRDNPPGSVGRLFYDQMKSGDYEIQIVPWTEPRTQLDFFNLRSGQTHDFEHILCGGGFNFMGELVPYWYRLTNIFKHIRNPELAGELTVIHILGSLRYTVRTLLHYPHIWTTAVNAIQRGMKVGQESDALFLAKLEDIFHLPVEEARRMLGVRGVEDVDTRREGEIFAGRLAA
jgi:ubiquinone biosynthesis protein COQ4